MAAATTEIDTPERPGLVTSFPVAAATIIYAGILVTINADGNAVPASDAANLLVVGRAEETVNNAAGAAGDVRVNVKKGVFHFANSTTAAIGSNSIGKLAVVEDNQTVAESSVHKVKAGRVVEVESDGVWIDTRADAVALAPVADEISDAADLAELKPILVSLFTAAGILK